MKSINQNTRKIVVSGILLTIMILFYACAAFMANFGRNQRSSEARDKFESFQVVPNYDYYYIGSNVRPDAVIAVDKSYTVTSVGIWTKVVTDRKEIKFLVETMQNNLSYPPYGYTMLDPKGKQIGLYYSRWDPWPVKMEGENMVWIYPPDKNESIGSKWGK